MKNLISQFFLLFFAGLLSLNAQSVKTHSSVESKFGVPNAKVNYTYYLDENGHEVRHGAYSISGTKSETSYGWEAGTRMTWRTTRTINLSANFKQGNLNGNLTYRVIETVSDNGKVSDKKELKCSYQFVNGELSGPIEESLYENGSPTSILKTGLKDGHRIGTYKSFWPAYFDVDVTGAFDNNGNMTGHWKLKEKPGERHYDMQNGYVTSYALYKSGSAKPLATIDSKIKSIAQSYAKGSLSLLDLIERGYLILSYGGLFSDEPPCQLKTIYSGIGIDDSVDFQKTRYVLGSSIPNLVYNQRYVVENLSPELLNDVKTRFLNALNQSNSVTEDISSIVGLKISGSGWNLEVKPDKTASLNTSEAYAREIVGKKFSEDILDHYTSILSYYDFPIPAELIQSWFEEKRRDLEKQRIEEEQKALRLAEEKRKQEARAAWIVSAGETMDVFTSKLLSISNEHRNEILAVKTGGSGTAPCLDPSEWENLVDGYSFEKMLELMPVLKISPAGKGKDNQYADYIVTFDKTGSDFSAVTKQVRIYMSDTETPKIDFSKSFTDMKVVHGPWEQILEKVDSISSINSAILAAAADKKTLAPFLNSYQNYHNACDLKGSPNLDETEARIERALETHQRYYRKLAELKTIADNDTYLQSALASFKALKTAYSEFMDTHSFVWNDTMPEDYFDPVLFAQEGLKSAIQDEKVSAYNIVVKSDSKTLPEQWFSKSTDSGQLYLLEKAETVKVTKKSTARSGWTNAIEAGLFPVDTYSSDDWNGDGFIDEERHFLDLFPGIGYSLGYKTGSGLYLGVAFDVLKDPNTDDNPVLPIKVFASGDGRFYFNKEKNLQPYIGARAGVVLDSDVEGFFVNPNLGIGYVLGGKKMVFGTVGYMQYMGDYSADNGTGRLSLTIGFAF